MKTDPSSAVRAFHSATVSFTRAMDERLPRRPPASSPSEPPPGEDDPEAAELPPVSADARP